MVRNSRPRGNRVATAPHDQILVDEVMACRHLKRGYPLAQTALEVGFCDQSALTKHFKRWYGITPQQFADAARAAGGRHPEGVLNSERFRDGVGRPSDRMNQVSAADDPDQFAVTQDGQALDMVTCEQIGQLR